MNKKSAKNVDSLFKSFKFYLMMQIAHSFPWQQRGVSTFFNAVEFLQLFLNKTFQEKQSYNIFQMAQLLFQSREQEKKFGKMYLYRHKMYQYRLKKYLRSIRTSFTPFPI